MAVKKNNGCRLSIVCGGSSTRAQRVRTATSEINRAPRKFMTHSSSILQKFITAAATTYPRRSAVHNGPTLQTIYYYHYYYTVHGMKQLSMHKITKCYTATHTKRHVIPRYAHPVVCLVHDFQAFREKTFSFSKHAFFHIDLQCTFDPMVCLRVGKRGGERRQPEVFTPKPRKCECT